MAGEIILPSFQEGEDSGANADGEHEGIGGESIGGDGENGSGEDHGERERAVESAERSIEEGNALDEREKRLGPVGRETEIVEEEQEKKESGKHDFDRSENGVRPDEDSDRGAYKGGESHFAGEKLGGGSALAEYGEQVGAAGGGKDEDGGNFAERGFGAADGDDTNEREKDDGTDPEDGPALELEFSGIFGFAEEFRADFEEVYPAFGDEENPDEAGQGEMVVEREIDGEGAGKESLPEDGDRGEIEAPEGGPLPWRRKFFLCVVFWHGDLLLGSGGDLSLAICAEIRGKE